MSMKYDLVSLKHRKATLCDIENYRTFSVLAPIIRLAGENYLLFEIRSETLDKQPNEICFPGGKIENGEDEARAAVRETAEELMIPEQDIEILGELDTVVTPFNSIIYPFAGLIKDYNGTFSRSEVQDTFYVPVRFFLETQPLVHYIDVGTTPREDFPYHMVQEGRNYPWARGRYPVYFYTYASKIIWGITARIVHNFARIIEK